MTKSTIVKTWIGGLAVFAAGILAATVGVFLMLAYGGTFTQVAGTNNYDFAPDLSGFFWTAIGVIVVGGLIALIGGIVQLVAYVGSLVNSYALSDKAWFVVLLVGGILSLAFAPVGFAVMVAYIVAAPDGSSLHEEPRPALHTMGPLAPTS